FEEQKQQEQRDEQDATISELVLEAIRYFGEALDRDDTDLDLWRRTAKLSQVVQSSRLARFCLESIVDDDVDIETEVGESIGLERAFANETLQNLLSKAGDDVTTALRDTKKPRTLLRRLIEQKADPFPFLANPTTKRLADMAVGGKINHTLLSLDYATWTSLGDAILQALREKSKDHDVRSSGSVKIELPDLDNDPQNESSHHETFTGTIGDSADKSMDISSSKDTPEVVQSTETPQGLSSNEGEAGKTTEGRLENCTADKYLKSAHSRKRSSMSVDDPGESGRIKSKRLRARESQIESTSLEAAQISHTKYLEDLLEPYILADETLFSAADNIYSKLGWSTLGSSRDFRTRWAQYMQDGPQTDAAKSGETFGVTLAGHLRSVLDQWDDEKAKISSENLEICVPKNRRCTSVEDDEMKRAALDTLLGSLPQENAEEDSAPSLDTHGLAEFVAAVNNGQMDISSVAFRWLKAHLSGAQSSYLTKSWPTDFKRVLTTMIVEFDSNIYAMIHAFVLQFDQLNSSTVTGVSTLNDDLTSFVMMAQALFELHLEILSATTKSDPVVAPTELSMERNRVGRWRSLAYLFINHQMNLNAGESVDSLKIRHLWTAILHLNMSRDADSDYILESLRELKETIISLNSPVIRLVNNSIMREISANSIEQEVSRLRSLDFFTSLLAPGNDEPVQVIEHIAPLLEPDSVEFVDGTVQMSDVKSRFKEAAAFLNTKSPSLRLYLWHRLQDAYDQIDHFPKVIDCCIHKIEVVVDGLFGKKAIDIPAAKEGEILLKSLNSLSTLLSELRQKAFEQPDKMFDCLDMPRLRAATEAFTKLLKLPYTFIILEDAYKIGLMHPPDIRPASNARSLDNFKEKLRCILVECCTLQYIFFKEAISQNSDLFDSPCDLRLAYLHACHRFLGMRFYCKYAGKAWLRLMLREIQNMPSEDDYEYEMAQLYFDLYGLKFGAGLDAIVDHHCPFEPMDIHTAISIVDFIMMQAKRINIKDLPKSELKAAIDTVQMSIGPPTRNFPLLNLNRRLLKTFLQSPIDHRRLFRCFDGIEDISISRVNAYSTRLAQNGWFTLLGQCALTRFRSQKRLSSTPTDDLDTAVLNFRQELEHGFGDWKTWYLLAQTFDLKLEEEIQWSADKINKNDEQIVEFQRSAINAYIMAFAHLTRSPDLSPQDIKMSIQLHADFGNRLYASSREPLSMKAFSVSHVERPFSTSSHTLYTSSPFAELRTYTVWELASYLFQQAISAAPGNWKYHFMYSKCLWKLFCCDELQRERRKCPSVNRVLDAFVGTIDSLPRKRDSRSEPILEPHYKLASVVHKLVARGHLTVLFLVAIFLCQTFKINKTIGF
ncbi:Histone transcription regulator 3, partial [Ascosphaera aggregata]